ncbi:hypothetical protein AGMMS4952_16530 [Spirochaetia bacterium]|nr:hypothetical protein AGMMS4952_16530 [Spirochaetia bacterium]
MTKRRKCGRRKGDYVTRYLLITSFFAHIILGALIVTGCPVALSTTLPLDVPEDVELTAPGGTVTIPVTKVELDPVILKVGQPQNMVDRTRILPADASDRRISYSITNTAIAELISGNVVYGKAVGTTNITVISRDGEKTATTTITVQTGEPDYIAVESVAVSPKTLELYVGQSSALSAVVQPANATYRVPIWTSEDGGTIASVDPGTGEVTGRAPGTAVIYATTGGGISDTCRVNVLSIPATGLALRKDALTPIEVDTLSGETITLHVGETKTIYADVTPAEATNGAVQWTSANTSLVSTETPLLEAEGSWLRQEVTIRARSTPTTGPVTISAHVDGVTPDKTFFVNVLPAVNSVTVSPKTLELFVGQSSTLTAVVLPVGVPVWISEDGGTIASVDPVTGRVTGRAPGTAVIHATRGGISDTCTVNVRSIPGTGLVLKDAPYLSSDNLSGTTITLHVGETKTIYADVTPAEATNGAVQWTSANTNLVSTGTPLLPSGSWLRQEVTIRAGSTPATGVTISAHVDGVTPDKTFTVNVVPGVADGIVLKDDQSLTSDNLTGTIIDMYVGETKTIYADVTPSTTINGAVQWTSSDSNLVLPGTPLLPPGSWLNQAVTIMAGSTPTSTPVAITAHIEGGVPDKTFHVNVLPIPGIPATGLFLRDAPAPIETDNLSGRTITLHVGETKTIYADVTPAEAINGAVQWTSANSNLVTTGTPLLPSGSWLRQEVTIRAGSTPTTALTEVWISAHVDGVTPDKAFRVRVIPGVADGIVLKGASGASSTDTITGTYINLVVGDTKKIYADVTPSNTINGAVTMTSADGGKVTVTRTGLTPAAPWTDQEWTITGQALTTTSTGSVIITAHVDGEAPDKTFFVNVLPVAVNSVTVSPKSVMVNLNQTTTLTAAVSPSSVTATWESEDPSIATVSSSGVVTGKESGTVKIYAKAGDKSDFCEVTVNIRVLTVPYFTTVPWDGSPGYERYTGPAVITYNDVLLSTLPVTVTAAGTLEYDERLTVPQEPVRSITLKKQSFMTDITHLIGRGTPSSTNVIKLNLFENGQIKLRDPGNADGIAISGYIPIGSYAEFQQISAQIGMMSRDYYKQEADLDLLNENWEPVGNSTRAFSGYFDGNGKTLKNLKILKDRGLDSNDVGLFGGVDNGAVVKNVKITSGTIVTTKNNVGGVAGVNRGVIDNCENGATVKGNDNVGGLAGVNESFGTIQYSTNKGTATVEGIGTVGGVVGYNKSQDPKIENCSNEALVKGQYDVGGVAGHNTAPITNSFNKGTVNGFNNPVISSTSIGGVVGKNEWRIENCYNEGAVDGTSGVGGVAGSTTASIYKCYNKGTLSGDMWIGGVVGDNLSTTTSSASGGLRECYNTGTVYGKQFIGGLAGKNSGDIRSCINRGKVGGFNERQPNGSLRLVGGESVGGLAGATNNGSIVACYNEGEVRGMSGIGGLVGEITTNTSNTSGNVNPDPKIEACYNIGDVTHLDDVYGTSVLPPTNAGTIGGDFSKATGTTVKACYFIKVVWGSGETWPSNGTMPVYGHQIGVGVWGGTGTIPTVATLITTNPPTFYPSVFDSSEWNTGANSTTNQCWKSGTTGGGQLPKLNWEQ